MEYNPSLEEIQKFNSCLVSTEVYKKTIKPYRTAIQQGNVQKMHIVVNAVEQLLSDKSVDNGMSQLNAMRLIKEVLETKNEMRELVAKNILPIMKNIAQFNSESKSEERGRTYFSANPTHDQVLLGNSFLRLVLECIMVWGKQFYQFEYTDCYVCLFQQHILFPNSFNYFKDINYSQLEEQFQNQYESLIGTMQEQQKAKQSKEQPRQQQETYTQQGNDDESSNILMQNINNQIKNTMKVRNTIFKFLQQNENMDKIKNNLDSINKKSIQVSQIIEKLVDQLYQDDKVSQQPHFERQITLLLDNQDFLINFQQDIYNENQNFIDSQTFVANLYQKYYLLTQPQALTAQQQAGSTELSQLLASQIQVRTEHVQNSSKYNTRTEAHNNEQKDMNQYIHNVQVQQQQIKEQQINNVQDEQQQEEYKQSNNRGQNGEESQIGQIDRQQFQVRTDIDLDPQQYDTRTEPHYNDQIDINPYILEQQKQKKIQEEEKQQQKKLGNMLHPHQHTEQVKEVINNIQPHNLDDQIMENAFNDNNAKTGMQNLFGSNERDKYKTQVRSGTNFKKLDLNSSYQSISVIKKSSNKNNTTLKSFYDSNTFENNLQNKIIKHDDHNIKGITDEFNDNTSQKDQIEYLTNQMNYWKQQYDELYIQHQQLQTKYQQKQYQK